MDKKRIALVGAGGMGQLAHLRNYLSCRECAVVALAELRPGLAEAVARRSGIPAWFTDPAEMLARGGFEGLVAIQPFGVHARLIPDLLPAGVPVLIEKPLSSTVEGGQLLAEASRRAGVPLYVAYHKRSDPAVLAAREEIARLRQTGELGDLRYARLTMPPGCWDVAGWDMQIKTSEPYPRDRMLWSPRPEGVSEREQAEFEFFVNYYIHQVNLLRFLLGETYQVRHADRHGRTFTAETASGVVAILEMAPWNTTRDWQESALVCFERGWVRVDLPAPLVLDRAGTLTLFRDPGAGQTPTESRPVLPNVHAMRQQARHFLAALDGAATPLCRAEEALEDLAVAASYLRARAESATRGAAS